jgi:hypothetical protein
MSPQVTSVLILTATCVGISYFSFRRNHDTLFAAIVGVLIFAAFLAGALLRPVDLTAKHISFEYAVANDVSGNDRSRVALSQQSLDNLPNIPTPGQGNIDFIAIRRGASISPSATPVLRSNDRLELRGWAMDPLAHASASGLFLIVNSSRRIDESGLYGTTVPGTAPRDSPNRLGANFTVDVPASALRPGVNELQLAAIAADQRGFFKLPDRVTVTVTER